MGLTSCRWITIAETLARPATRCATGIMPVPVSLPAAAAAGGALEGLGACGSEWAGLGMATAARRAPEGDGGRPVASCCYQSRCWTISLAASAP